MNTIMKEKPEDSQYNLDGISYKIGLRRKVFMWINGRWIASIKTHEELLLELLKEEYKTESTTRTY